MIELFPVGNVIYTAKHTHTMALVAHCLTSVGQSGYLCSASFICVGSTSKVTSLYSLGVFFAILSIDFTNSNAVKCSNAYNTRNW